MGIGPWAQGDLIRDVLKAERSRIRRLVKRELLAVEQANARHLDGGEQALHRILDKITPRKRKEKVDARVGTEAYHGF